MSFSTTTPQGKKSTHNVEPFMAAGPEYHRNWLGTVFTVIFGLHFLPNAIGRITVLVWSVRHGNWHNWIFYLDLVILIVLLILNFAILFIYYKALANPRFLHGVDSVDNLKPYKYYIFIFVGFFVLDLIIAIWKKSQEEDPTSSAFVAPAGNLFNVLLDILIYWAWGHKCDAHALSAKIFMPFLPKA